MAGIVHLIVFSNFEGFNQDPGPSIRWFEACSQAHPLIRWTHLYNPRHLLVTTPESIATDHGFSPYLLREQDRGRAEIGLHLHLFYDLVERAGVRPRAYPFAGDTTAKCDYPRTIREDPQGMRGGYDVLMTGYTEEERGAFWTPVSVLFSIADSPLQRSSAPVTPQRIRRSSPCWPAKDFPSALLPSSFHRTIMVVAGNA